MKAIPLQVFTLAVFILGSIFVSSVEAQSVPKNVKKTSRRSAHPTLREDTSKNLNRWFEFRAGPRFSMVDGTLRPGGDGSSLLDARDDLKLDDVSIGPQLDLMMRGGKDWYVSVAYALSDFTGQAITERPLLYHASTNPPLNPNTQSNPSVLPPGSRITTDMEVHTLSALFRYDALRERNFTLGPLFGVKAVFFEENVEIQRAGTGTITRDTTKIEEATPLLGFEAKLHFNRYLHLGIAPVGFAYDNYVYLGGQGYIGFNVDQNFGLRLGIDVDHLSIARDAGNPYATTSTLAAAYIQGVFGF